MTQDEFNQALDAAQKHIEDALVIMATLTTKEGLAIWTEDPTPFIDAFEKARDRLSSAYSFGIVYGLQAGVAK